MDKDYSFKISAQARRGTHPDLAGLSTTELKDRLVSMMVQKKAAIREAYQLFGPGCTRLIRGDLEAYNAAIDRLGSEIDRRESQGHLYE